MDKLSREDLYSLEGYAEVRSDFRAKVMAHKRERQCNLGEHVTLYFEDRLTMQYQVQEMLRIERIFEPEEIEGELSAYNPLIPDGANWKATMMVEYEDPEERKRQLARLIGIEKAVWVRVAGFDKVRPIANEDLERETEEKTSSVHFLRFELTPEMVAAVRDGAAIGIGVDHPDYQAEAEPVPDALRQQLAQDMM